MKDLFEHYEQIPVNLQSILNKYEDDFNDGNYIGLEKALKECNKIGFTFEFGLDGVAFNLCPIKLKEFEVFKNGTQHATIKAKNLREAKKEVFSWYGEKLEVYKV
jgi:hypothetical protein